MYTKKLRAEVKRLKALLEGRRASTVPLLERLKRDPAAVMSAADLVPDPWQMEVLSSTASRVGMLAARQVGKTVTAAALALREALLRPNALVLVLSPSLRQSGEFFRAKLLTLWRKLGSPLAGRPPTRLELELSNGSRVVSLPEAEGTVRGFSSVRLLVIDEAARVSDELYCAVRPMLAVSGGRLVALSTPFGQRGWFYEMWHSQERWHRVEVKASQCPRLTPEFLAEERAALGPRWYAMEFENAFLGIVGAVFDPADVDAAVRPDLQALALE
jgi:hypothetical protein